MAGYSGTPLAHKLGVRPGERIAVLGSPEGFVATLAETLPAHVTVRTRASGPFEVMVAFHTRRAELVRRTPALLRALDVDGGLWIAWPKKASGVVTDVTEHTVREVFLPQGLVDNKVCAIDDVWSALRVVWRKARREPLRRSRRVPQR
ncbi:MAG: DUF3052 domain-containing protein [Actinomycetota bacterium]|nr:DUF3052 domain-containing protein [Actinomycetota bacterium]